MKEGFDKHPVETLKTVIYSIREDDYNQLPAFILMPFSYLFGQGRVAYILSIVNIFAFSAAISFVLLHRSLCKSFAYNSIFVPAIPVVVLLLSPNFWLPVLSGFVDVGGILLINLILLLYFNRPFSEQRKRDFIFIAFLIPMLILFRRWYAYWGLAFYITLIIYTILNSLITRPINVKDLVKVLIKIFFQIVVSIVFLFIIAPTFSHRIFATNYADIYSAYRHSSTLLQSFIFILGRFGLFFFTLFLIGAITLILDKKTRNLSLFLVIQWVIIFWSFSRTQDFDSHQLYLLLPTMYLFVSLLITKLIIEGKHFRIPLITLLIIMSILNFLPVFSSTKSFDNKKFGPLFTNMQHYPYLRNDIQEFDKIFNALNGLLSSPKDRVYVLASSAILNSNMMNNAFLSLHRYRSICLKILTTHDIDKRDGFPQELLDAKYVIVADPIQYTERPKDQRVIGIPAELILSHIGIGASFEKLPYEFTLDGNVKVYIYKKIKSFNKSDLFSFSKTLRSYYPDRSYIFEYK